MASIGFTVVCTNVRSIVFMWGAIGDELILCVCDRLVSRRPPRNSFQGGLMGKPIDQPQKADRIFTLAKPLILRISLLTPLFLTD